jgi:hypothetical protein
MKCADNLQQLVCYTTAGGVKSTLLAHYTYSGTATQPTMGALVRTIYTDASGAIINTTGGTVVLGQCPINKLHTYDWAQVIPAGGVTFMHNLGLSGYATLGAGNVMVRNAATGAEIAVRVTGFTANSFVITVTVPTALALITFTGSDK